MNHFKHVYQDENHKNMKDEVKVFKHLRTLKNVNRLSGMNLIQTYSVAEHCYYTGLLFETIAKMEGLIPTMEEITYVYTHDILESVTGDILRPAKSYTPNTESHWKEIEKEIVNGNDYTHLKEFEEETVKIKSFSPISWELFMYCDVLELWLFCEEEDRLGNRTKQLQTVRQNCLMYIRDEMENFPSSEGIFTSGY